MPQSIVKFTVPHRVGVIKYKFIVVEYMSPAPTTGTSAGGGGGQGIIAFLWQGAPALFEQGTTALL
jgi:hypothetical protein